MLDEVLQCKLYSCSYSCCTASQIQQFSSSHCVLYIFVYLFTYLLTYYFCLEKELVCWLSSSEVGLVVGLSSVSLDFLALCKC